MTSRAATAGELLDRLYREGITVELSREPGMLLAGAKDGVVPESVKRLILAHKPAILHELRLRAMRERLLILAGSLGIPDALVYALPESELAACCEQAGWLQGEDVRHKLLGFYLRSLAGIEPALPGSLAAREAPARRAHVAKLKEPKP